MGKVAIAIALSAALAFPGVALGTFPGRDGRLAAVYSVPYPVACEPHECEQTRQRYVTMDTSGRRKHELFRCDPCGLAPLDWSRDGRRVAWRYAGAVFTSAASGGGAERQGQYNVDPAWQPAGIGLALWSSGT